MRTKTRQCEFGFTNWGGKRRGAGRKPKGERAGISHAKRPELDPRHPLHVTLKIGRGITNLRTWRALELFHELGRRVNGRGDEVVQIVEFSVQCDHVHMIVEAQSKEA